MDSLKKLLIGIGLGFALVGVWQAAKGSPWALALWPLGLIPILRSCRSAEWIHRPWCWRRDVPRAMGLGLAAAVLAAGWMSRYSLVDGRYMAPDFNRYCGNLAVMMSGDWGHWHEASSLLSAWILAPIAGQVGLMASLEWGALLGFSLVGSACYLWAGALYGRLAGIAAVCFTLTLMPLLVMSRTLTFYPLHVGLFTLATAAGTVAMLRKSKGALLFAGVAIGFALLADVRGLLFALPALASAMIGSFRAPRRAIPVRLALVLVPLLASWGIAQRAYLVPSVPLEEQVSNLDSNVLARRALGEAVHTPSTQFVWGQSSLFGIPGTLNQLRLQADSVSAFTKVLPNNQQKRAGYVWPWKVPALAALVLTLLALARKPWALCALGLSLIPAALALRSVMVIEITVRFLGAIAPALAVLLGIAFAALVAKPKADAAPPIHWPLREPLALLCLGILILGILPSWLSPNSPRKASQHMSQFGLGMEQLVAVEWGERDHEILAQFNLVVDYMGQPKGDAGFAVCREQLLRDVKAGKEIGGGLFR
jgi:hypothetical protein